VKRETFATEKLDLKLLAEVVKFKKIYFASAWANYDSAFPATMKLVPNEALHKLLREDYKAMRGSEAGGENHLKAWARASPQLRRDQLRIHPGTVANQNSH
jgi:hypothetical protein